MTCSLRSSNTYSQTSKGSMGVSINKVLISDQTAAYDGSTRNPKGIPTRKGTHSPLFPLIRSAASPTYTLTRSPLRTTHYHDFILFRN